MSTKFYFFYFASNQFFVELRPDSTSWVISGKKLKWFRRVDFATSVAQSYILPQNRRFLGNSLMNLLRKIFIFCKISIFSKMIGFCATLVAKSTRRNHFNFLPEIAQVILSGRCSTKNWLLAKQKKIKLWGKKNSRFFSKNQWFSDPP